MPEFGVKYIIFKNYLNIIDGARGLRLAALLRRDLGVIWLGAWSLELVEGCLGGKFGLERRVYRGNNGLDYGANKGPFFSFTPIS